MKCFQPRWTCRSRSFFRKNSIVKNNAEEGETFHYPSVAKLLLSSLLSNSSPYDLATNFSILFFFFFSLLFLFSSFIPLCSRLRPALYVTFISTVQERSFVARCNFKAYSEWNLGREK